MALRQLAGVGRGQGLVPFLCRAAAQRMPQSAAFTTTAPAQWPDILAPSMGESIKEGSITQVLKQPGQPVKEDEVIAQIETDKVTIDVRSPTSGTLQQLLVKAGDTVVPGQLVASVTAAGAAGAAAATAPAASGSPAAPASPSGAPSSSGRTPMITFPDRRSVPAAAAAAAAASAPPASAAAAAAVPPTAAPTAAKSAGSGLPAGAPGTKLQPAPPRKWVNNALNDGRGPPRRPLKESELEAINLGGAF